MILVTIWKTVPIFRSVYHSMAIPIRSSISSAELQLQLQCLCADTMPLIYGPASNIIMLYPNRTGDARTRADISAIFETEKSLGDCRYSSTHRTGAHFGLRSLPFHAKPFGSIRFDSSPFHSILIKI